MNTQPVLTLGAVDPNELHYYNIQMVKRLIINWLKGRIKDYDLHEKGRLCAPCNKPCGDDLCGKVGCLNMDMRSNSLRLRLLVKRLIDYGYDFPERTEGISMNDAVESYLATGYREITKNKTSGEVINLDDYRKKDDSN